MRGSEERPSRMVQRSEGRREELDREQSQGSAGSWGGSGPGPWASAHTWSQGSQSWWPGAPLFMRQVSARTTVRSEAKGWSWRPRQEEQRPL